MRHTAYAAHTNLAASAWRDADIARMLFLLGEQRPERTGGKDLRGFEWYYLWRLCHSDLLTLRGHSGPVWGVCFSPDGTRVVGFGGIRDAGVITIWDRATGEMQAEVRDLAATVGGGGYVSAHRLLTHLNSGPVSIWGPALDEPWLTVRDTPQIISLHIDTKTSRAALGTIEGSVLWWE